MTGDPLTLQCIACGVPVCVIRPPVLPPFVLTMLAPALASIGVNPGAASSAGAAGTLFGFPPAEAAQVLYVRCLTCDGFNLQPEAVTNGESKT